jgi:hypothetical protein
MMRMLPRDYDARELVDDVVVEAIEEEGVDLSQNTCGIDFIVIVGALTPKEMQHHHEGGLPYKCHKKGHRAFNCPKLKSKGYDEPSKKQK